MSSVIVDTYNIDENIKKKNKYSIIRLEHLQSLGRPGRISSVKLVYFSLPSYILSHNIIKIKLNSEFNTTTEFSQFFNETLRDGKLIETQFQTSNEVFAIIYGDGQRETTIIPVESFKNDIFKGIQNIVVTNQQIIDSVFMDLQLTLTIDTIIHKNNIFFTPRYQDLSMGLYITNDYTRTSNLGASSNPDKSKLGDVGWEYGTNFGDGTTYLEIDVQEYINGEYQPVLVQGLITTGDVTSYKVMTQTFFNLGKFIE